MSTSVSRLKRDVAHFLRDKEHRLCIFHHAAPKLPSHSADAITVFAFKNRVLFMDGSTKNILQIRTPD